jgi:tetratricopeptide (TPR) repeat protein
MVHLNNKLMSVSFIKNLFKNYIIRNLRNIFMTIKNLFTLILLFLFFQLAARSFGQVGDEEYKATIIQADNYFKEGDYINAKTSYQYASRLKPGEQYPKDRLQETITKIRDKMVVVEQFSAVVAEADKQFKAGQYELAKSKYDEAKKILPEDTYPDQQLNEIKRIEEAKIALENEYSGAVANGEKFIKYKKYELAKAEFEKAFALRPEETNLKEKIAELQILIEETNRTKAAYEETLAGADRLFNLKYFENARKEYEKALNAKPDEDYPAAQIKEIDKILVQKNEFDHLVQLADDAYGNRDLEAAKANYQAALKIYPNENYPKTMIDKVNTLLTSSSSKDELYQKSITEADKFLSSKDYTNALKEYENASALKPAEQYPAQKIEEVNALIEKISGDELEYNRSVQRGEQLFAQKDYPASRTEFTKASQLKPDESYPNEKLQEINNLLKQQDENQASFDQSVAKAEQFLNEKDYDKALSEFQKALVIMPEQKMVTDRIAEINRIKSGLAEKDKQLASLLADADNLFNKASYTDAKSKYNEVLVIDPLQEHASARVAEIDLIQTAQREKENDFNKAIAAADIYYKNKEYENAKIEYQKASSLNPSEQYPAAKLLEINNLMEGQAAQQNSYDQLIASADKLFNEGKYQQAKIEYQKALDMKPGEKYPALKIAEINDYLNTVAEENRGYDEAIGKADELFNLKKYEESNLMYMKASNIKPKEQYPRDRMAEIDQIILREKTKLADYNVYISAGDRMLESKEYDKAKEKYNLALSIMPEEKYPKDKLKEVEGIIYAEKVAVQEIYNKLIAEGDELLVKKEFDQAKVKYNNALKYKPDELYPVQKLGEIEGLVSDMETLKANYNRLIADADVAFKAREFREAKSKYVEASALFPKEEYPITKIEEINLYYKTEHLKLQQSYDKSIADADKFFASGIYDQALESYRTAKSILPDETYPDEMINRILGILDTNAVRDLVGSPVTIGNNEEKRLKFEPVLVTDRKGSIIFIKARNTADTECKVVVSYGKGSSKNGGYILPIPANQQTKEYIIPIGKQYTWFSQDNDWISLVPQGGAVEVILVKISKGN